MRFASNLVEKPGEFDADAHDVEARRAGQGLGAVHLGESGVVKHPKITDQLLDARPVSGGGDDVIRAQNCPVDHAQLVAANRVDGRHDPDPTRAYGGHESVIKDRDSAGTNEWVNPSPEGAGRPYALKFGTLSRRSTPAKGFITVSGTGRRAIPRSWLGTPWKSRRMMLGGVRTDSQTSAATLAFPARSRRRSSGPNHEDSSAAISRWLAIAYARRSRK